MVKPISPIANSGVPSSSQVPEEANGKAKGTQEEGKGAEGAGEVVGEAGKKGMESVATGLGGQIIGKAGEAVVSKIKGGMDTSAAQSTTEALMQKGASSAAANTVGANQKGR